MPQEDTTLVKLLTDTVTKSKREFPGIAKLKIDKKDRHMKTLQEFSTFVEVSNESLVQETLRLSRDLRETLEEKDAEFQKIYNRLLDDDFLIVKSEQDLFDLLKEYKRKVKQRSNIVEQYASDLDGTETKRTSETAAELKALVDKLIAIAHALPDEIEHTVEAEAFEINTEVINNRKSHSTTLGALRITQVKVEAETIQKWEEARMRWRKLRHDKALKDFEGEITSAQYFDPQDRQSYMKQFQSGQESRHHAIRESLNVILALNCQNISSEAVTEEQANLASINDHEISAIKDCYDSINFLREGTNAMAQHRVEALRRELHTYGALKLEPDLAALAVVLQKALNDESLAELWRLGGGLKPEFQAQIADMTCADVIYPHIVTAMQQRLEMIVSSFNLRALEEERGKLAQLDRVKGLITKLRSAPRAEVPAVLRAITPELEDIVTMDTLPALFKSTVLEIISEINTELVAMEKRVAASSSASGGGSLGGSGTLQMTSAMKTGTPTAGGSTTLLKTAMGRTALGTTGGGKASLGATGGKTKHTVMGSATAVMTGAVPNVAYVDHGLVKAWNRKLGVLFYGDDLPTEYQEACTESLKAVNEQQECNQLVDAVVTNESAARLATIDRKYKKHISNIVNYLEVQATNLSVTTANIADFYLIIAKIVEAHRAAQKELDEKSADEIWDLKEDFRLELEDHEAEYEAACQRIREATKQEELQELFEAVLKVLETIQQSYRNYHSKACFSSDKYPLMLLHEFYSHLKALSKTFYLQPLNSHLIVTSYEALFDQTVRFNKKYFDENPVDAVGFERIPLTAASESAPGQDDALFNTANMVNDQTSKENALAGRFRLTESRDAVIAKFRTDAYFAPPDPNLVDEPESSDAPVVISSEAALLLKREPHPECPWMAADSTFLPTKTDEEIAAMEEDERDEYSTAIMKGFINLDAPPPVPGEEPVAAAPVKPAPKAKGKGKVAEPVETGPVLSPELAALSPEDLERYNKTKELAEATKVRLATEAEASYILAHPPMDVHNNLWIKIVEVTEEEVVELWNSIRDSVYSSLELESFQRLRAAERLNGERKTEYTDQLEDQIRNHWPRRGRVETQIKQPREAELLGHKEKTWRHIQSIQQKMMDAQARFDSNMSVARSECDSYIHEMTALRNSLSGDSFKNLASLQGVDVKARGTTISFQATCVAQVNGLNQITDHEAEAIAAFARDFRKVCPPQVPGQEGGYSESEIAEIEALVEGQCAEIDTVAQEWRIVIAQLQEQQEQSLKCQDEFSVKYEKCVQDLAMSEGLGQKYGAPRRRAQERIRTEVSRDDQAAGIVDEMLAKLEFICSEAALKRNESDKNTASDDAGGPETSDVDGSCGSELTAESGKDGLRTVTASWGLLNELRDALQIRATYLNVVATPLQVPPLPWMSTERVALGDSELTVRSFPVSKMTLEEVFEEVDATCRRETKELYDSEGKSEVLTANGANGIPESLQLWLTESKHKLLGRHGHREKAWKRFWSQVERSEALLARNLVENDPSRISSSVDKYSTRLGVPAVCMKYLTESFILFAKHDRRQRVANFASLIAMWEKARDKHERQLRPKLGSPDMIDELNQLDSIELQRSTELVENILKFRGSVVRALSEHLLRFCEDVATCTKGFILLMDSTMRLEVVQVPPDTTIPKKHMTMKKLRKAQRIQEAIAAGEQDRSQSRVWNAINTEYTAQTLQVAEDMVPDLGSNPADLSSNSPRGAAAAPLDKKAAPSKKGSTASSAPVEEVKPSLIPASWIAKIKENSEVAGLVGTSHRILIAERDSAVKAFTEFVARSFDELREDYDTILKQEQSWNERWKKQVGMLKQGNV